MKTTSGKRTWKITTDHTFDNNKGEQTKALCRSLEHVLEKNNIKNQCTYSDWHCEFTLYSIADAISVMKTLDTLMTEKKFALKEFTIETSIY